jgi:hypothetical protein
VVSGKGISKNGGGAAGWSHFVKRRVHVCGVVDDRRGGSAV